MNPNWIRTTVASILLAVLLKVGLHVPFFTTFITLGIIFVMHVVLTEMGTGTKTVWTWAKSAGRVAMGVVIFLAIRFLAGKALNLYPIDTSGEVNNSGGLYGILPGRDTSTVILWEMAFAFVAGSLTVSYVRNTNRLPVRIIFVFSLLVLTLQLTFPRYTATWPTRDAVSTNLVNDGVVGTMVKAGWRFAFGKPATPPPSKVGGSQTPARIRKVVQMPDMATPCTMEIEEIRDIYTDGEAIYALPPGWPEGKAIPYSGKGHLIVQNGNIHSGRWKFWSADPSKVVLIRIFAVK